MNPATIKYNKIVTIIIIAILIYTSVVEAFGVSTPYWGGHPLYMKRGEEKIVNLNLQNMVGDGDVSVQADFISGQEIAKIDEKIYEVKFGTHDTMVPLKIKIPRDATPGETTSVNVEFKTITPSDKGVVALGTGMSIGFDVIVSEEIAPREIPWTAIISILVILVLLVSTIIFIKKRKHNQ